MAFDMRERVASMALGTIASHPPDTGRTIAARLYRNGAPDRLLVQKHQHTNVATVSRLTITLSEARYRALKQACAQRSKTIGQLIDESLDFYGIKSRADASELVSRARTRAALTETAALEVARQNVKSVRRKP
jgi:hypothetical protein